ncbi:Hypothetical protein A7982_02173 [Minicystis rosea]|nr:Hypothetical protein A7982_02173 [Minicystis rosea]
MLIIRDIQAATLVASLHERLVEQVRDHLRAHFGDDGARDPEVERARAVALVERAARYGLTSPRDCCDFANVAAAWSWRGDHSPEHAWIEARLQDPRVAGASERMRLLAEESMQRLEIQERNRRLAKDLEDPDPFPGAEDDLWEGILGDGATAEDSSVPPDGASKLDRVRAADEESRTRSAVSISGATQPCPLPDKARVEARVVGEDGEPLAGIAVQLRRGDGEVTQGKTTTDGRVCFAGIDPGDYDLGLPELDMDAWDHVGDEPVDARAATGSRAAWGAGAPAPADPTFPRRHVCEPGECVTKLAARFGFLPDTLWGTPENRALREAREDGNILDPGDVVVVPARRLRWIEVTTGQRYLLKRKGIPARFRVRFLIGDHPRIGVPYLLEIETDDSALVPHRRGSTDEGGFVEACVPPSARAAKITLGKREIHHFRIGEVRPIDTVAGVQERLENLGYRCDDEVGVLGASTRDALRSFQRDHGLTASGDCDKPTRATLRRAFLS